MEINLLALSIYNVEQIQKNREFFNTLISRIKSTYKVFKYSESIVKYDLDRKIESVRINMGS